MTYEWKTPMGRCGGTTGTRPLTSRPRSSSLLDETTKTLRIPLPDDQRDLTDPKVKAVLLPSGNVIGGEYGGTTIEELTVGDNDTAQELELNFGKDGTNDADADEGDTLKIVVKRLQQDADNGTTATFTVRVESDRMGVDHVLDGWDSLPGNNGVYKDYPMEISGSDTEVEQSIDVPENGTEEDDWTYTASIRALADHEGERPHWPTRRRSTGR